MTTSINSKDRLIFALDVPDKREAQRLVKLLHDSVGCFKVGLQLFVQEGPDILKLIKDHSTADIFLDLKLHDIPIHSQYLKHRKSLRVQVLKYWLLPC